jgi:HPt (histidine-containing phosphotransfer) domain-containing protein
MSEQETPTLDASVIDGLRALEAGGATGLVARVSKKFLVSAAELSHEIRTKTDAGDSTAVGAAAHKLKSSSAQVGALKLSETARKLEELGRRGSLEGAPELVSRMSEELAIASEALTALGE